MLNFRRGTIFSNSIHIFVNANNKFFGTHVRRPWRDNLEQILHVSTTKLLYVTVAISTVVSE